ncbi:MAG: hypothetical protein RL557_1082 [archaeon]|jgi:hypothetical protein
MEKKSQSAMEFLVFSGVIIFFLTVFFVAIQQSNSRALQDEKRMQVEHVAFIVQDEINLASESTNGYQRTFQIPATIIGLEYQATIVENSIFIKTTDGKYAIALPLLNVSGQIMKGNNTIKKINNSVFLN